MQTPIELRLDRLTAELQDLRYELKQALGALPTPGPKWVSTSVFAKEVGMSGKTIQNWLSAGRFPDAAFKRRRRGKSFTYLLDREPALEAAHRIMTS